MNFLADRYRPLPTVYTLPFLLTLHLPLLNAYASRVASSLDAFESLSFGLILPGALAEGRAATAGVGGVNRLVRAGVSAKWMGEKCLDWGDDTVRFILSNSSPKSLTIRDSSSSSCINISKRTSYRKNSEKRLNR